MRTRSTLLKLMLCLTCIALIALLTSTLIQIQVRQQLHLQTAYITKIDIPPRTRIEETDLQQIQLPGEYINENVITDKSEIIGKYTDIQGKIPAGSLFYRSMVMDESEIPDLSFALLKEGQCIFSLQIESASSFIASQRVDLFWKDNGSEANGILVEHARILEIKDPQGINIEDEESTGIPYIMDIAVNKTDFALLNQAKEKGTFTFRVSSDTYDVDLEATISDDADLISHIQDMIQIE